MWNVYTMLGKTLIQQALLTLILSDNPLAHDEAFPSKPSKSGPIEELLDGFFERQIHHYVERLHNARHPEASIINAHRVSVTVL